MWLSKVKAVAATMLVLGLVIGTGLSVLRSAGPGEDRKVPRKAEPLKVAVKDKDKRQDAAADARQRLARARVEAARKAQEGWWSEYQLGRGTQENVYQWSRRLVEAERAASTTQADYVKALEAHLERMREMEKLNKAWFEAGRVPIMNPAAAEFFRLEAEIWLTEAQRAARR